MEIFRYDSDDKRRKICAYLWEPIGEPKAVIQFVHGMQEHMGRYEEAAEYFADNGFAVAGNDYLGHGKSACTEDDYGYFTENNPGKVVAKDVKNLTQLLKERYKGKPLIVVAHSMGTFVIQRVLEEFGNDVQAICLIGTGCYPYPVLLTAKLVVNLTGFIKGERYRSRLIKFLVMGSYNKKIDNPESESAWLTRDAKIVKKYDEAKDCGVPFTVNGYRGLFDTLLFIQKKANRKKLPKDLPMLFLYGDMDPVAAYGKAPEKVAHKFRQLGIAVETKCYEACRHELLNELNRKQVMQDLNEWMDKEILNGQKCSDK